MPVSSTPYGASSAPSVFRPGALGVFAALETAQQDVVNHPLFEAMADGRLPADRFRQGVIGFYPLVEVFPDLMEETLRKTRADHADHLVIRGWLSNNLRVEQKHPCWYRHWAEALGVSGSELTSSPPCEAMKNLIDFLWRVQTHGTLAAALGVTHVGIEWATGEWSRSVGDGLKQSFERTLNHRETRRALVWVRAHTRYQRDHAYQAMGHVVAACRHERDLNEAIQGTRRALGLYRDALDAVAT